MEGRERDARREVRGCGRSRERRETGGAWVWTEQGGARDGRCMGVDGAAHGLQCMRQTVKSWPKRQDCCMPEPQCLKFDGWNGAWRGLMLLHASWNGCQKLCCNGVGD